MREKRLHLCQVINSTFLEFGTLNEKEFNEAIKIALEVSEDVLEQDENRETIRAECNAMMKKGFYFQIEKIRDEDSIDKKFNYTFVCTNKVVGEYYDGKGELKSDSAHRKRKLFKSKVVEAILKQGKIGIDIGEPSILGIPSTHSDLGLDFKRHEILKFVEEYVEKSLLVEFHQAGDKYYKLSPKSILELDGEIRCYYEGNSLDPNCAACKSLVIDAIRCPNTSCNARYHKCCAKRECSKCKKEFIRIPVTNGEEDNDEEDDYEDEV